MAWAPWCWRQPVSSRDQRALRAGLRATTPTARRIWSQAALAGADLRDADCLGRPAARHLRRRAPGATTSICGSFWSQKLAEIDRRVPRKRVRSSTRGPSCWRLSRWRRRPDSCCYARGSSCVWWRTALPSACSWVFRGLGRLGGLALEHDARPLALTWPSTSWRPDPPLVWCCCWPEPVGPVDLSTSSTHPGGADTFEHGVSCRYRPTGRAPEHLRAATWRWARGSASADRCTTRRRRRCAPRWTFRSASVLPRAVTLPRRRATTRRPEDPAGGPGAHRRDASAPSPCRPATRPSPSPPPRPPGLEPGAGGARSRSRFTDLFLAITAAARPGPSAPSRRRRRRCW